MKSPKDETFMSQQHILQVSELTKKVKFMLESELNTVWLSGEISNFIAASSGHWYLSLKDNKSQVKCAMFKGNNRRVRLSGGNMPRNGQQVLVRAKVSLYEPRGDFQVIIELMEDAGEGLLRQQYEQLKAKLNAQGLFAQHIKQVIQTEVKTVGIITSPTGAAVKDILSVLKRRNPLIKAIIYPALVQGDLAKNDLVSAIKLANQRKECDVLIIGRGGGSLEDLWPFNEEEVVRVIHQSNIPTISAVGHEIDTTLCDYVADLRAATPTAAAELVSADIQEIALKLTRLKTQLQTSFKRIEEDKSLQLQTLLHRLKQTHPEQQLQANQQKADDLAIRLNYAITTVLSLAKTKPQQLRNSLKHLSPLNRIEQNQISVQQYQLRISSAIESLLQHKKEQFVHNIEQIHLLSPLATIARGYSVARSEEGKIIKEVAQVSIGENIELQMSDGFISTKVQNISNKKN